VGETGEASTGNISGAVRTPLNKASGSQLVSPIVLDQFGREFQAHPIIRAERLGQLSVFESRYDAQRRTRCRACGNYSHLAYRSCGSIATIQWLRRDRPDPVLGRSVC
jgi:hypothetical protein